MTAEHEVRRRLGAPPSRRRGPDTVALALHLIVIVLMVDLAACRRSACSSTPSGRRRTSRAPAGGRRCSRRGTSPSRTTSDVLDAERPRRAFINSLFITIPATVIPVMVAAFAAYAFAWMNFPYKNADVRGDRRPAGRAAPDDAHPGPPALRRRRASPATFLAVWLAHTGYGLPFAIYLLRNYMGGLPREVFESASIDGASPATAFFRLALPMSVPAIASLAIFQFLFVWNDLLVALIYIGPTGPENLPLTVASPTSSTRSAARRSSSRRPPSSHGPAARRVPGPAALLRPRHHRRCRQGLTAAGPRTRSARAVRVDPEADPALEPGLAGHAARARSQAALACDLSRRARPRGRGRLRRRPAAPSTVKASLASRARAASRKPSASASSFSSRARSRLAARPSVAGRDARLDVAGDDGERARGSPSGRSGLRGRRVHARRAAAPGPAARSPDGGPRTSRRARPATATSTGSQRGGLDPASARALRIARTRSISAPTSASTRGVARAGRRPGATMSRSGSSARWGSAAHSSSVTNGMTGWSSRRYVSSASTSVHHVASRSAAAAIASARRTLASSRPQSQNSDQMASYRSARDLGEL